MTASEIRLNNIFEQGIVSKISAKEVYCFRPYKGQGYTAATEMNGEFYKIAELKPILLTEERLLRFGFTIKKQQPPMDMIAIKFANPHAIFYGAHGMEKTGLLMKY